MPVYLFTYHTYRSWMPDHPRGYTKRNVGYLPSDPVDAARYERRASDAPTVLTVELQQHIVDQARTIPQYIEMQLYAVTTEPSHIHMLAGWEGDRSWMSVRNSVKTSISK